MRRELDYIADDRAALRWALGCVIAGYAARLAALPRLRWRIVSAPVVAASLLLLLGFALQGHATDQSEPTSPALKDTTCDLPEPVRETPRHHAPVERNRSGISPERKDPKAC